MINDNKKTRHKKKTKLLSLMTLIICYMGMLPSVSAAYKKVSCGNKNQGFIGKYAIPAKIPKLSSYAVNIIEVAVPVVIILLAMIDLIKAISSGKEDDMKKAQGVVVKRLIAGGLVFFIFVIVKLLVSIMDSSNSAGIIDCMNCFINNSCKGK